MEQYAVRIARKIKKSNHPDTVNPPQILTLADMILESERVGNAGFRLVRRFLLEVGQEECTDVEYNFYPHGVVGVRLVPPLNNLRIYGEVNYGQSLQSD